jgi:hypothetical protein
MGPDDRRGALNYIIPAEVLAAAGEVRLGRTVSLAAPVEHWVTPGNPDPCQHHMKEPLKTDAGLGLSISMDRIAMNIHGNADSHIDALCHVIFDGKLYNGVAAEIITKTGRLNCPSAWSPTASSAAACSSTFPGLAGWPGWSPATMSRSAICSRLSGTSGSGSAEVTSCSSGSATGSGGTRKARGTPPRPGPGCTRMRCHCWVCVPVTQLVSGQSQPRRERRSS